MRHVVTPDVEQLLEMCQRVAEAQSQSLKRLPRTADRAVSHGIGSGGDTRFLIDRLSEEAALREITSMKWAGPVHGLSEETGEFALSPNGAGKPTWILLDPLDGSYNAVRNIPAFALSVAAADGPAISDVYFGYVYDLATGDEFYGVRGRGSWLNGDRLEQLGPNQQSPEVIAFESVEFDPRGLAAAIRTLSNTLSAPFRSRIVGSTAVALCGLAARRYDAFISTGPCRTVDFAAAQLIAREGGATLAFDSTPIQQITFDLDRKHRFTGATDMEWAQLLVGALP